MVKEKIKEITDKTMIPLSLVSVFIGGVVWLTTLNDKTEANTRMLTDVKDKHEKYERKLDKIIQDLGYIKGKLGIRDGE